MTVRVDQARHQHLATHVDDLTLRVRASTLSHLHDVARLHDDVMIVQIVRGVAIEYVGMDEGGGGHGVSKRGVAADVAGVEARGACGDVDTLDFTNIAMLEMPAHA